MFIISYIENRNVILCQFLKRAPSVGDAISIKGRKGKVVSVDKLDDKHIQVQVSLISIEKSKLPVDNSKKKKR